MPAMGLSTGLHNPGYFSPPTLRSLLGCQERENYCIFVHMYVVLNDVFLMFRQRTRTIDSDGISYTTRGRESSTWYRYEPAHSPHTGGLGQSRKVTRVKSLGRLSIIVAQVASGEQLTMIITDNKKA